MRLLLTEFIKAWRDLGGGTSVPHLSNMTLENLPDLLPTTACIQMSPDGALMYKKVGEEYKDVFGRDVTGLRVAEMYRNAEFGGYAEELYGLAMVQHCGLYRQGEMQYEDGARLDWENVALPFIDPTAFGGTVLIMASALKNKNDEVPENIWGQFNGILKSITVIPSPRLLTDEMLTPYCRAYQKKHGLSLKMIDVNDQLRETSGFSLSVPSVTAEH